MAGFSGIIDIDVAITAAPYDLFQLDAHAAHGLTILSWRFGQRTELGDAQDEELTLALYRISGSPTSGSGGSTVTMRGIDAQGMTPFCTFKVGNTTPLSGGTSEQVWGEPWKVLQPHLYQPVPGEQYSCYGGEHFVLRLLDTPADSIGGTNGVEGTVRIIEY